MSADSPPTLTLFDHIELRRRELGLRPELIVHPNTRRKIKRGEAVRPDVYITIDRKLRWEIGSAERAARGEGSPVALDATKDDSARRLHVTHQLGAAVASTHELDQDTLMQVEALADTIWRIIDSRNRR